MEQSVIFNLKEVMDYTREIIEDWFNALHSNHVGVQPKATTLLKNVLDRYDIKPKEKNVWQEFMTVKAGEFDTWYNNLTSEQQIEFNLMRSRASEMQGPGFVNGKSILKG
jgi:hypothetical protein